MPLVSWFATRRCANGGAAEPLNEIPCVVQLGLGKSVMLVSVFPLTGLLYLIHRNREADFVQSAQKVFIYAKLRHVLDSVMPSGGNQLGRQPFWKEDISFEPAAAPNKWQ